MVRKIALVFAVFTVALPTVSTAKDMTQKFALGFYSTDAPVAVRYWVTEKAAIDAGIGLRSKEVTDLADSTKTTNTISFWFEAGVPYKVFDTERAHFFVRPGVVIGILDDRDLGTGQYDKKWTQVDFELALGAEVFFGEHFSLDAAHGFVLRYTSPPSEVGDSTIGFGTFGRSVTRVGFRFYF